MSAPEVGWVLDQLTATVTSIENNYTLANGDPVQVERIDRDDSNLLEAGIRSRTAELQEAVYVGAGLATRTPTPMGSGYDHQLETVVGLRFEGLHHSEYGHVDPAGSNGVPFDDEFVRQARRDILDADRTYPSIGRSETAYYDARFTNESSQSSQWADYYRYDVDLLLFGEETLP